MTDLRAKRAVLLGLRQFLSATLCLVNDKDDFIQQAEGNLR